MISPVEQSRPAPAAGFRTGIPGEFSAAWRKGLAPSGAVLYLVRLARALPALCMGHHRLEAQDGALSRRKPGRSAERSVGKECVNTCQSRWSPDHSNKTDINKTQNHKITHT